jgi:hypothetical protein
MYDVCDTTTIQDTSTIQALAVATTPPREAWDPWSVIVFFFEKL